MNVQNSSRSRCDYRWYYSDGQAVVVNVPKVPFDKRQVEGEKQKDIEKNQRKMHGKPQWMCR
jgi:hypothetical protein